MSKPLPLVGVVAPNLGLTRTSHSASSLSDCFIPVNSYGFLLDSRPGSRVSLARMCVPDVGIVRAPSTHIYICSPELEFSHPRTLIGDRFAASDISFEEPSLLPLLGARGRSALHPPDSHHSLLESCHHHPNGRRLAILYVSQLILLSLWEWLVCTSTANPETIPELARAVTANQSELLP
ncbi:unnamed protein product [Peniophora sp. CBMAI 1063]|nr:unnamed protein product [Peniophora sp. CBMAI 1063]